MYRTMKYDRPSDMVIQYYLELRLKRGEKRQNNISEDYRSLCKFLIK